MALSNPRILYGVHSIAPYSRSTKLPYGILKVIGGGNLALSSEIELLYAGANKAPWAAEGKTLGTELQVKLKAYPDFLFELFLGASVVTSGADSAGSVSTITDAFGGSVVDAAVGIASVAVIPSTGAADLKFGKYVVKAMNATTINIYGLTDIDFKRGTDVDYQDDSLKILAANVTIPNTSATVDVASLGLRFTGGSGTVAMTTNHTATFEVKPPSSGDTVITVGSSSATFPSFGAVMLSQKRATGELFEIDALNMIGSGLPINLEEQAFSVIDAKLTALYDSTQDAVFKIRHYIPE